MKYLVYLVVIYLLLILNFGVFGELRLIGAVPNLMLLFVISLALISESLEFVAVALFAGIIWDTYGSLPIGSFALGFVIVGLLANLLFRKVFFYNFNWKHFPLAVISGIIVLSLWLWIYTATLAHFHLALFPINFKQLLHSLLPTLIYNLLLMYPVYGLTIAVNRWIISFQKNRHVIV